MWLVQVWNRCFLHHGSWLSILIDWTLLDQLILFCCGRVLSIRVNRISFAAGVVLNKWSYATATTKLLSPSCHHEHLLANTSPYYSIGVSECQVFIYIAFFQKIYIPKVASVRHEYLLWNWNTVRQITSSSDFLGVTAMPLWLYIIFYSWAGIWFDRY